MARKCILVVWRASRVLKRGSLTHAPVVGVLRRLVGAPSSVVVVTPPLPPGLKMSTYANPLTDRTTVIISGTPTAGGEGTAEYVVDDVLTFKLTVLGAMAPFTMSYPTDTVVLPAVPAQYWKGGVSRGSEDLDFFLKFGYPSNTLEQQPYYR